ncbi:MAG: HDOD domain-containing protein [Gammaproteobacteria bacterium]|nr:HDOD domain-containing protein [Gammaproteobacteria bacterium]
MRDTLIISLEDTEANKLPSLPHILIKLLSACRDDNICFEKISDIISKDASLSAKVIAVANSPVYGHARHLTSLKHILMFLGLDTIKSIAITASVKQFFSRYSNNKSQFLRQFWKHALSCAITARSLAQLTNYKYVEEAYIAGLLHDIGKLVLEHHDKSDYCELIQAEYPVGQLLDIEKQKFNITHDELGGRLLSKWGINEVISDSVRYHHAEIDDIQDAHHLVKIINLANIIVSEPSISGTTSHFESGLKLFDLSEALLNNIRKKSLEEVELIAKSLEIDIGINNTPDGDEQKQIQLAQEVRDISLIHGSHIPLGDTANASVYTSIQQSLMILFGIQDSIVFEYNETDELLARNETHRDEKHRLTHHLEIPLRSNCMVSRALISNDIVNSLSIDEESISILDQQIIRSLNNDGILCIPIVKGNHLISVIVAGINKNKNKEIRQHKNLLNIFKTDIAEKITAELNKSKIEKEISANSNIYFKNKAREIIHETNNPLSIIRNYLHILGNRLNNEDPAQDDIKIIKEEIDRVGNIVLRCAEDLDDQVEDGKHPLSINNIIIDLISIFKSSLFATHNITPSLNLDENIGLIYADKDTLKQIITNVIKNAVEAIKDDGEITITTGNINVNGKIYVELEIQDTGPGIDDSVLNCLYTPIKTKKGKGHSGLGLSIIKNLIDGMSGTISCRTSNKGTIFNIQIPKYENNSQ